MDDRTDKPARPGEDDGKRTGAQKFSRAPQRVVQLPKDKSEAWRAERDLREANIRRELERIAAVGRRHSATSEDPEIASKQTKGRPQR